jgi:tetratricopeptide (TPR) repeat protein
MMDINKIILEKKETGSMTKGLWRRGVLALALIAMLSLAGLTLACTDSNGSEETTTTMANSDTTTTDASSVRATTTVSVQPLVIDGQTPEEYEAALPELEKAAEADPENLEILQELAVAQFQLKKYKEAAATYEKMLALKDDAFTHNNYGNVLRNWGKIEEAKAQYRQAIAGDPSLGFPYVNLALILDQEGGSQEAVELLQGGLDKVGEEDKVSLESLLERLTAPTTTT